MLRGFFMEVKDKIKVEIIDIEIVAKAHITFTILVLEINILSNKTTIGSGIFSFLLVFKITR